MKNEENIQDRRIQDMTSGDPKKLILTFMLPLMGGNCLQQLYTVTDAMIVGKGVGVTALAAIGATDWIYWFMLWAANGFGQGFSIMVASYFGEKNFSMMRKSVRGAIKLSVIAGIAMAAAGALLAAPALRLLNTPENIYSYAHLYVVIMYIGIFAVLMYNTVSCILRALGDSRTPFLSLLLSTLLNITLDLLFVLVFHWGVAGAAIASGLSQAAAGLFCFRAMRKLSILEDCEEKQQADKYLLRRLWSRGLITGLQYSVIAVGGMVVQYAVNSLGIIFVAGFTATNKLYGVLECIATAMGSTMLVYTGQNYGAKKLDRIQQGTRVSLYFGIATSLAMGAFMILFGRRVLMLFISGDAQLADQVLAVAYRYLFIMSLMLITLYTVNTYRYTVMGLNRMKAVVLSSAIELIMRVIMALLVVFVIGKPGIYFVEPAAWVGASLQLILFYYWLIHKLKKNGLSNWPG